MTSELQHCIGAYERQAAVDISSADHSLLTDGMAAFQRLSAEQRLAPKNVRAAAQLFDRLGKTAVRVDLLTEYLARDLDTEEEAWARWERTDTLAVLRRFGDAVASQRGFYAWAAERLEPHRLLWVMHDGSQALAWWASGQLEAWLAIVRGLRTAVPVSERTRWWWFQLSRTEARVLEQDARIDDALVAADRISALADRYPAWEQVEGVRLEAEFARMGALSRGSRGPEFDAAADRVTARLAAFQSTYSNADRGPQQYGMLCHNAAAPLYFAQQYVRAAPLFRESIRARPGRATIDTYIWLAASVWATTHDRREVMGLLRTAANRDPSRSVWRRARVLAEFGDLADDVEFEAAARGA